MAGEALERPGQGGGGRLVAGDEQGHQLVAELGVGHRRRRPRRARRGAARRRRRRRGPARRRVDLLADQLVARCIAGVDEARHGLEPARAPGGRARSISARAPSTMSSIRAQRVGSCRRSVARAEDRAHDDLERHRLHARAHGERRRPRGHVATSRSATSVHQRRVRGACARRGRRAAAACAGACARAPSSSSTERGPSIGRRIALRLARVEHGGIAGEDLLDGLGVREHHPRALVGELERERVAVALAQPLQPGERPRDPSEGLRRDRQPGPGRERHTPTLPARDGRCLEGADAVRRAEAGRAVVAGDRGAQVRAASRSRWSRRRRR